MLSKGVVVKVLAAPTADSCAYEQKTRQAKAMQEVAGQEYSQDHCDNSILPDNVRGPGLSSWIEASLLVWLEGSQVRFLHFAFVVVVVS